VNFVVGDCRDMSQILAGRFDVVFISNFFEHLENKHDMDRLLQQVRERLRADGRVLVLQPNIRYLGPRYREFYDHHTALTHVSVSEALVKNGFEVELVIPKFLPYTFKSRLPTADWMVRLYLRMRLLMDKQMFVVAVRPC
jgi:SAM-dependent methyltransferase